MHFEISRAKPLDDDAILRLHREAGWADSRVDGEVWVARQEGELVGSLQFVDLAPELLLITAMVIREDRRGRGIGRKLLAEVLRTRSADWWLECRRERIRFYSGLGFGLVDRTDVPSSVLGCIAPRSDRKQFFMSKNTR